MSNSLPGNPTVSQEFFNGYYNQSMPVNPDIYNQVYSFFLSKTDSVDAAKQLTQNVMILTYNNRLDPLSIINDFKKSANDSELKTLMISFFNSFRGPTSKIGFSNAVNVNQWVQRNIKA